MGTIVKSQHTLLRVRTRRMTDVIVQKAGDAAPPFGAKYSVQVCDVPTTMAHPECEAQQIVSLSDDFYKGDRSMRESGYDISFRFGPYSAATHHFAPMCLNSLLYKTETDLEKMARILGHDAEAEQWKAKALLRRQLVIRYMWDDEKGSASITTSRKSNGPHTFTSLPYFRCGQELQPMNRPVKWRRISRNSSNRADSR